MRKPIGYSILALSLCFSWTSCEQKSADDEPTDEDLAAEAQDEADAEADAEKEKRDKARKAKLDAIMAKMRSEDAKAKEPTKVVKKKKRDRSATSDLSEEDYQKIEDKLVARGGAKGTALPTFTGKDGRTFEEVIVKDADSIGITIYHRAGSDQIDYADLPVDLQAKFLYDEKEAADAIAGIKLPTLPAARRRAVGKRIGEAQMAGAQADARAAQEALAKQRAGEKAIQAKLDDAVAARKKAASAISRAEDMLYEYEEAAEIARYGAPDARIKKSGADSVATREADARVERQRNKIQKAQMNLKNIEAKIDKLRIEVRG